MIRFKSWQLFIIGGVCLQLFLSPLDLVQAEYVLPYPSSMPGSKLYRISQLVDSLKGYWHWGDIASFKHHLALSDKYLVESKILFEYRQYVLAIDALQRSNVHFSKLSTILIHAAKNGKDISRFRQVQNDAAMEHVGQLERLLSELPEKFLWTPEKASSAELHIHDEIRSAKKIRESTNSQCMPCTQ